MSTKYDLRIVADGASDAWDTAPESHKPILRDCSDALTQAADNIELLQAIIDRQHAALVVAGTECDELGESDLHALACIAGTEDGRCEPSDDDYAEAYIRAVEALQPGTAEKARGR